MTLKNVVDIVSKVVTALATILAGGWAYYRFIKGRVFVPRLTLAVTSRCLCIDGTDYVMSRIHLANVGLSKIDIDSSTLRVCSLVGRPVAGAVTTPQRVWLETRNVLLAHSRIESGEVLNEQNLLTLPLGDRSPILIDVKVVAAGFSFTATAIAEPMDAQVPSGDPL
jgi:hypothetical protein